jgi:hypothetical protein
MFPFVTPDGDSRIRVSRVSVIRQVLCETATLGGYSIMDDYENERRIMDAGSSAGVPYELSKRYMPHETNVCRSLYICNRPQKFPRLPATLPVRTY